MKFGSVLSLVVVIFAALLVSNAQGKKWRRHLSDVKTILSMFTGGDSQQPTPCNCVALPCPQRYLPPTFCPKPMCGSAQLCPARVCKNVKDKMKPIPEEIITEYTKLKQQINSCEEFQEDCEDATRANILTKNQLSIDTESCKKKLERANENGKPCRAEKEALEVEIKKIKDQVEKMNKDLIKETTKYNEAVLKCPLTPRLLEEEKKSFIF
eukprot:Pgem_evm2s1160